MRRATFLLIFCGIGVFMFRSSFRENFRDVFFQNPVFFMSKVSLPNKISFSPRKDSSYIPKRFFPDSQENVNNFTFPFVHKHEDICRDRHIFLILTVRSAASDQESRNYIRKTWGNEDYIDVPIVRFFLIGIITSAEAQKRLDKENEKFNDILQVRYKDSYKTLPLKTMTAYKWARDYCAHAHYFLMADADVLVDMYKLIPLLKSSNPNSDSSYTLCKVEWTTNPLRNHPKAGISKNEYSSDKYAPYCWGGAYVAPLPVINKLYLAGLHTPMIKIDDVWLGILAERAGIHLPPNGEAFVSPWNSHNVLSNPKIHDGPVMVVGFHGKKKNVYKSLMDYWQRIQKYRAKH